MILEILSKLKTGRQDSSVEINNNASPKIDAKQEITTEYETNTIP